MDAAVEEKFRKEPLKNISFCDFVLWNFDHRNFAFVFASLAGRKSSGGGFSSKFVFCWENGTLRATEQNEIFFRGSFSHILFLGNPIQRF